MKRYYAEYCRWGVNVSYESMNGNAYEFYALEPYEDDISINPNGHVIVLTSFISHFYE